MSARLVFASWVAIALAASPFAAVAKPWRAVMAPGDVAKAHEKTEDTCDRCHLPFKGIPDEKCFDCHAEILRRVRAKSGFHASVSAKPCIECHTDHRGRSASLTKTDALKAFRHADTAFALEGAHAKIACASCHDRPLEKLGATCGGCHEDPHAGSLGASCKSCHASSAAWKTGVKAREQHRVRMDGGHRNSGCKDCHARGEHLVEKVACASCHEAQHGGTTAACDTCHQVDGFAPAKHDHSACTCKFPGIHLTFDCLGCHQGWKFTNTPTLCSGCHAKTVKHEPLGECSLCHSALSWKRRDHFDHNKRSVFKLDGEHLTVDCTRCHEASATGKFRGAPKACEGCHAAEGAEAHGEFGACARCHTTAGFERPTFDHASTGFPLTGRHAKLECRDCHSGKVKRAELGRVIAVLASASPEVHEGARPQECKSCHEDPHKGSAQGACSGCHTTEQWRPSTFDRVRHAETKFPLRGKHETAGCTKCHVGAQLAGLPQACSACHFDPHRGRLGAACESCHNESGFKPVPGFDHAKTGFALAGPHVRAKCERCHEGERGEALAKRTPAGASAVGCATCHVSGHGKELGLECSRCHALTPDSAEHPATFGAARGMAFPEHARTGFILERRHRSLACRSCHPASGPAPDARCASCHLDPHSGQLGQNCEECHRADRFRLARFDHDRAGWPLRGRHFITPCATCHTSQRWVGLTTECFDCHALDAARARMTRPDEHAFGPADCRDCHTSLWTWR